MTVQARVGFALLAPVRRVAGLHDGVGQSGVRVVMGHNNVGPEAVGPAVTRPPLIPPFFFFVAEQGLSRPRGAANPSLWAERRSAGAWVNGRGQLARRLTKKSAWISSLAVHASSLYCITSNYFASAYGL